VLIRQGRRIVARHCREATNQHSRQVIDAQISKGGAMARRKEPPPTTASTASAVAAEPTGDIAKLVEKLDAMLARLQLGPIREQLVNADVCELCCWRKRLSGSCSCARLWPGSVTPRWQATSSGGWP
jgi:hypothetical protein